MLSFTVSLCATAVPESDTGSGLEKKFGLRDPIDEFEESMTVETRWGKTVLIFSKNNSLFYLDLWILFSIPHAMTTRLPSGYLFAGSSIAVRRHALLLPSPRLTLTGSICQKRRKHAQGKPSTPGPAIDTAALPKPDTVKSALNIVEANAKHDPVNAPSSTLPPPLNLPTRGSESTIYYYYRIGRAYGTFYKEGLKAVWFNHKAAKLLKERITKEGGAKDVTDAVAKGLLTRSDFQVLARNSHDIGKLPLFGLLVLIFGEWLPLIVPFIPNAVPGTCRIPKQVRGMREKAEERRRLSFKQGITEPSTDQLPNEKLQHLGERKDVTASWPMAFNNEYRGLMLKSFRDDQLYHLSSTLGLHSRLWDRIQLSPPSFLLRRAISKRLQYVTQDDLLLLHNGKTTELTPDELHIACEERGLDILGKRDDKLHKNLSWWLKRQQEDAGWGRAMLAMLFRRLAIREWVKLHVRANNSV